MYKAIVIDDEALARKRIQTSLKAFPEIQIVSECKNGEDAIKAIYVHAPEIIFLDIHMPKVSGFDVLDKIDEQNRPYCIFVTAHPQFAIRAFDYAAQDYLLKPYRQIRFDQAIQRALSHLSENQDLRQGHAEDWQKKLAIDLYNSRIYLHYGDIEFIQADGNYVKVKTADSSYFKRVTLTKLETELSRDFVRVHRSYLVNKNRVTHLRYLGNNEYEIQIAGTMLRSGRSYKANISANLERGPSGEKRRD